MVCQITQLLIVGGESDPNTQRMVDQAHLRDLDYVFWDTDSEHAGNVAWDFHKTQLDLGDLAYRPESIFLRYNVFNDRSHENAAVFDVIQAYAFAWPAIRMMNRRTRGEGNNKSRNLAHARSLGFEIPETIVLGNLAPLESIPDPESKIAKPLAGGDHAVAVSDIHHDQSRLASMPPQFIQEKLDGDNLRVFSIGGQLFGFRLNTTALDYRTDDNVSVETIEIPEQLIGPTHKLVQEIGFDYCALDFRCRDGMDSPVFLEINSFPMFVAFDDACGNQLADAMLEYLIGAKLPQVTA